MTQRTPKQEAEDREFQLAREHQVMRDQFVAYVNLYQFIEREIEKCDARWESTPAHEIDRLAGRKAGLVSVRKHCDRYLTMRLTQESAPEPPVDTVELRPEDIRRHLSVLAGPAGSDGDRN